MSDVQLKTVKNYDDVDAMMMSMGIVGDTGKQRFPEKKDKQQFATAQYPDDVRGEVNQIP